MKETLSGFFFAPPAFRFSRRRSEGENATLVFLRQGRAVMGCLIKRGIEWNDEVSFFFASVISSQGGWPKLKSFFRRMSRMKRDIRKGAVTQKQCQWSFHRTKKGE